MHKFLFSALAILMAIATPTQFESAHASTEPALYLVSFTAEWCPNCVILDPKLDSALNEFSEKNVTHVALDMTDAARRKESFEKIDGTLLAGVYGDHLGVTGIGILTAADSGEKLGCVTREFSESEIITLINQALENVRNQPPLQRTTNLGKCPGANGKIAL